jgi:glutamate formiminotransferase/formiminotetrahydrofolate cyclodeaminase
VFLDELAAGTPTPGGGSAAAYAAAMAAALVGMVARLTIGKKKYAAVEERMQAISARSDALVASLSGAVERDAQAFEAVLSATRLPKETEPQKAMRQVAMDQATLQAAAVPLDVAHQAAEVVQLAAEAAASGNVNAVSDALSAVALASAALKAAAANVRVNIAALQDASSAKPWLVVVGKLESNALDGEQKIRMAVAARLGIPF